MWVETSCQKQADSGKRREAGEKKTVFVYYTCLFNKVKKKRKHRSGGHDNTTLMMSHSLTQQTYR